MSDPKRTEPPTADEMRPFFNQQNELTQRVLKGIVPVSVARKATQAAIEGSEILFFGDSPELKKAWLNPLEQIDKMESLNGAYNLGFRDNDFANAILEARKYTDEEISLRSVPVLVPESAGLMRSVMSLWIVASDRFTYSNLSWIIEAGAVSWIIEAGAVSFGTQEQKGLRWSRVDLGSFFDPVSPVRPDDISRNSGAGLEVLAAAVMFPEWVKQMGKWAPFVWLPGLKLQVDGWQVHHELLLCYRAEDDMIRLEAHPSTDINWIKAAVPRILE